MADRKAELEKKRKKLEELKRAREQNKLQTKDKEVSSQVTSGRDAVYKLVDDLVGPGNAPLPLVSSPPKPSVAPLPSTPKQITPTKPAAQASAKHSRQVKLEVNQLAAVNIRPKDVEVYAKQTQTDAVSVSDKTAEDEDEGEAAMDSKQDLHASVMKGGHMDDTIEPEKQFKTPHQVELSVDQVDRIMGTEDFSAFVNRSTRLMERALCETTDILFDQIINGGKEGREASSSLKVLKKKVFIDERWSQNRNVTSMDWSSYHPELLLVSYYTNPNIPHDPDGVALIWDLKFQKDTPDYIFNCQSPITSIAFSKFHPSYVIGGTYSGQIILWDMRSGKRTPIQRSPLSSSAHTHPIYCLDVVGSPNAHNLISISTDGRICSWNLDMLSQPQESLDLQNRQTRPVAVTCMSFASSDVNKFLVGSEECMVYQGQRHGTKPGIAINFEGHTGPITAVRAHRAGGGQVDLSHLFITSSFDWTIKLWTSKLLNEQQLANKTGLPLCSFENNLEYVYDVQWSPVHPAVFASGDGEGKMDIWNMNMDTEVPILSENLDASLSKLSWSPNGQHLACGDFEGKVHIFEAGEMLRSPPADEWVKMQQTLEDLLENQDMGISLS